MTSPAEIQEPEEAPRRPKWTRLITPFVLLLVIVAGILELIPVHYYAFMPGDAVPVEPMIAVTGYPPVRSSGQFYLTDVSEVEVNHKLEELFWRTRPNIELAPASTVSGNLSQQQYLQLNTLMMDDSKRKAEVAALSVTRGYKLHFKTTGPEVALLIPSSPAIAQLQVGDVIQAVDGHRTRRAAAVSPLIQHRKPGQPVRLQILRKRRVLNVTLRTVACIPQWPCAKPRVPLIGVYVEDQIALPVDMRINQGNIVGPSAGLMFTLGLVQRLSQRDLTHGCKVAGTGTMDFDGAVGAIGGAQQKVIAAQNAGAQYFFVPATPDNAGPAERAASHIAVVPVKTLQQTLKYLKHIKACR